MRQLGRLTAAAGCLATVLLFPQGIGTATASVSLTLHNAASSSGVAGTTAGLGGLEILAAIVGLLGLLALGFLVHVFARRRRGYVRLPEAEPETGH
jgi:hypothetical protein